MSLLKPISISLSPNVQNDDVLLAMQVIVQPWKWKRGKRTAELESAIKNYLGAKHLFSLNSGRSALFVILQALGITAGDEILLQAFTCNAVPNPVLWAGGKPVYVDIDETLNLDPCDLEKKITPKSKAVIIQNTFGVPAQMDKILEISRRHHLIVIEDCAHALGAQYQGKKLGTFGDAAFFSFGRDKIISSVWGGMIATNSDALAQKISAIHDELPDPVAFWIFRQLLHPILFSLIIPSYYIFGKYLLGVLRKGRGISLAVSEKERMGERPRNFPAKLPNAFAELASHQFKKLDKYNTHRCKIAEIYYRELSEENAAGSVRRRGPDPAAFEFPPKIAGAIYLRFNILHPHAKAIIQRAKTQHMLLGDWYKNTIDPIGTDFGKMRYTPGSCPNAEKAARESINLPTHINISEKDIEAIIEFLKSFENKELDYASL